MSGLPAITVIGTLTADPELRFTPSGAAVVNFTIAANSRKLNRDTGEWEDGDATFLRANLWRDAAENVAESLTRGTRVIATGALKQRDYEKDGEKRTVYELEVDEVGPSMKWAKAVVTKTKGGNNGGSNGGGGGGARNNTRNNTPSYSGGRNSGPANNAPVDDEPPF